MRTTKELLKLILENQDLFVTGICQWIVSMCENKIITLKESVHMVNYVLLNSPVPKKWEQYHFWPEGQIEPRIAWINDQIKRLDQIEEDNKNGYQTWVID